MAEDDAYCENCQRWYVADMEEEAFDWHYGDDGPVFDDDEN